METARIFAERRWTSTLQRLLFKSRAQGHGASFLLLGNDVSAHLDTRYSLPYSRISDAMEEVEVSSILYESSFNMAYDQLEESPTETFVDSDRARFRNSDANEALSGALDFVASMSKIDGLVAIGNNLTVVGFGAEARAPDSHLPAVASESATRTTGKRLKLERYGTRHRAVLRYCEAHPGVVGFVISADGPVRAVLASSKRVTMWENVELNLRTDDWIPS